MKIAIIELHYHEEFIHTLIQLFQNDDVKIFTTKSVYNNLPEQSKHKASFVFKHPDQKVKCFLSKIPTENYDYLFMNTIQPSMIDIPKYLNFKPKCPSCLTIHNLNAWYNKKPVLRKNLLHSADSFIASFYTKKLANNFGTINVVYEPMISYAISYFPHHNIINIPYSLTKNKKDININRTDDETWFVVPGTFDNRRRDYEPVFDAYIRMKVKHDNIKLVILGKYPYNDKLINDIAREANIIFFSKFVPRDEYDFYLRNSDFIICPSVEKSHTVNVVDELYGKTKSPNVHEAIKWRKPLMIPGYIPVPTNIEKSVISYAGTDHLEQLMEHGINHKQNHKKDADNNYYTTQKVYKRLSNMLFKEIGK